MQSIILKKCPICGQKKQATHFFQKEKWHLLSCNYCGSIYLNPQPNYKDLTKFYPTTYYGSRGVVKMRIEGMLTKLANLNRRKKIENYKKTGQILDLGCGTGEFLMTMRKDKWIKWGLDPNSFKHDNILKKKEIKFFSKTINQCRFKDNFFDVITAWHVIEHLDNPRKTLSEIRRILKQGGIFIFSTPNIHGLGFRVAAGNWFHLDLPRHHLFLKKDSLADILNNNGFEVIKINTPLLEYPFDLFRSMMNMRNQSFLKLFLTIPLLSLAIVVRLFFSIFKKGEIMEVICVKKTDKKSQN